MKFEETLLRGGIGIVIMSMVISVGVRAISSINEALPELDNWLSIIAFVIAGVMIIFIIFSVFAESEEYIKTKHEAQTVMEKPKISMSQQIYNVVKEPSVKQEINEAVVVAVGVIIIYFLWVMM